jgi:hypothetical protein
MIVVLFEIAHPCATLSVGSSDVGHCHADRQRNGGVEDVVRIVLPLGLDKPRDIRAVAFRRTIHIGRREQIRIPAGKRQRIEGVSRGTRPSSMSLLLDFVRAIHIRREDFHQNMVATMAESRSVGGYARGGAFKFVCEDRATRGYGTLRRLSENIDAVAVEFREPTGFHERALAIDEERVKC